MDVQLSTVVWRCALAHRRGPRKPRRALWRDFVARGAYTALALCVALASASSVSAARPEGAASTSRSAREDAIRGIQSAELTPEAQQKVASVLTQVSIFRRLPTQVIECDPKLYLFLVEHPDMVVNMWEVMDVSDMTLDKTGPTTFSANDGAGTRGHVEYLHRSFDTHILYADGTYTGPLFANPVHGRCLLVLKTGYAREENGRYVITCRLDAFIQLNNVGVELVAKTFQPLVGKTADHNFRETASFMAMISRSAEVRPQALNQLTTKLTKVDEADREEFAELAHQLTLAALEREDARSAASERPTGTRRTVMKAPPRSTGR